MTVWICINHDVACDELPKSRQCADCPALKTRAALASSTQPTDPIAARYHIPAVEEALRLLKEIGYSYEMTDDGLRWFTPTSAEIKPDDLRRFSDLHLYEEIAEHYAKCAISPEALRDWVAERMDKPSAVVQEPVMTVTFSEGVKEPRIVSWNAMPPGTYWLYTHPPTVGAVVPIDMVLHCPECHLQHIDAPAEAPEGADPEAGRPWDNPPHRSHLCHGCGHIWRPADVATNGVAAVKTQGKADSAVEPTAQPVRNEAYEKLVEELDGVAAALTGFESADDGMDALRSAVRQLNGKTIRQVQDELDDLRAATPPPVAGDARKSLNAMAADLLRPYLKPGQKVIWREPFRWYDDNGVLSNHQDGKEVHHLCDEFGYTVDWDFNMRHACIITHSKQEGV